MAPNHARPSHKTCRHLAYRMSCEQYETLLADCQNECMACGKPAAENALGQLVIDHDYSYGQWAVRGLICGSCNSLFVRGAAGPHWAQPYLTNPWFLREVARLGLSPDLPAEPPRDACLRDFDSHVWFFEDDAWRWAWNKSPRLTWAELFHRFGPTGLATVGPAELAASRGYKAYLKLRGLWKAGLLP